MMNRICFIFLLGLLAPWFVSAQNANTHVPRYAGGFLYGSNMQWLNDYWRDEDIADILIGSERRNEEGVGVTSLRPALYEGFVETYGYDVRVRTFGYYSAIGARHNVVFIGDQPSDAHRERRQYARGKPSESYENLYAPIWDGGENGTPVNDANHYALYVYRVAQLYKDYVTFWEVKNEPDFTYSPDCANNKAGERCNWWDKDPDPELLTNFHAPVQSYVRMLRISYEVIKSVDPEAFICVGGIGYESFLDAVLRNTDNPDGGKTTAEYPHRGGAWFDCLSYHIYPMYYLKQWSGLGFRYSRFSDAAVAAVIRQNTIYNNVLKKYGYDGVQYPVKEHIISETNLPNKRVDDYVGSEEVQRNYLMKLAVAAQREGIRGVYPFCPWDAKEWSEDGQEYDYKGFYRPLPQVPGSGRLRIHESGIGWRTVSRQLDGRAYDASETARLRLPANIDGGAFYSATANDYVYVLWAKTHRDLSETASASYTFAGTPSTPAVSRMACALWDGKDTAIVGNTLRLTGAPMFVRLNVAVTAPKIVAVSGVAFEHGSESIEVGKTLQLAAYITPRNATNRKMRWTSANTAVATIDGYGMVTAVAPGKTVITVVTEDGRRTAECLITTVEKKVELSYILISSAYVSLKVGGTEKLRVTFFPSNTTHRNLIWKSSNEKIVTIDKEGTLRGVSRGKANITVVPEGSEGLSKHCIVQVE